MQPLKQTEEVFNQVRHHFLTQETEAVESFMNVSGVSFGGQGQNVGIGFVKLKDWDLLATSRFTGGSPGWPGNGCILTDQRGDGFCLSASGGN